MGRNETNSCFSRGHNWENTHRSQNLNASHSFHIPHKKKKIKKSTRTFNSAKRFTISHQSLLRLSVQYVLCYGSLKTICECGTSEYLHIVFGEPNLPYDLIYNWELKKWRHTLSAEEGLSPKWIRTVCEFELDSPNPFFSFRLLVNPSTHREMNIKWENAWNNIISAKKLNWFTFI